MNVHARRLLQALYRATHGDPLDSAPLFVVSGWAKLPDLGVALEAAIVLQAAGFVDLQRSTLLENNSLRLTANGVAEAKRLQLPFWKRWASDRDLVQKVALLVIGVIFGAVGNVVVKWLIS